MSFFANLKIIPTMRPRNVPKLLLVDTQDEEACCNVHTRLRRHYHHYDVHAIDVRASNRLVECKNPRVHMHEYTIGESPPLPHKFDIIVVGPGVPHAIEAALVADFVDMHLAPDGCVYMPFLCDNAQRSRSREFYVSTEQTPHSVRIVNRHVGASFAVVYIDVEKFDDVTIGDVASTLGLNEQWVQAMDERTGSRFAENTTFLDIWNKGVVEVSFMPTLTADPPEEDTPLNASFKERDFFLWPIEPSTLPVRFRHEICHAVRGERRAHFRATQGVKRS